MGFVDDMKQTLSDGAGTVRGVAANVIIERSAFARRFARLATNGWQQGWHERNGGNLSYRLPNAEVDAVRKGFDPEVRPWTALETSVPELGGMFFLITGAGCYLQNVADDPSANCGIIEIDPAGSAWRIVWGLTGGGRPTSELPAHLACHSARMRVSGGRNRVLYHAHPSAVAAMTLVEPLDSRTFSRALWKALTECVVVFPQGVGVVPWMVPGSASIAETTAQAMEEFSAVVWPHHGLIVAGDDFDDAFGLAHTVEKAADIYLRARCAGSFLNTISDEGLAQIGEAYGVEVNRAFLDL